MDTALASSSQQRAPEVQGNVPGEKVGTVGKLLERLGRNLPHRAQFGLGESRERQLCEIEARMGLPQGSLR